MKVVYKAKVFNRSNIPLKTYDLESDHVLSADEEDFFMGMIAEDFGRDPARFNVIELVRIA